MTKTTAIMQDITSWTNGASHLISGTVKDGLHVVAGLVAGLGILRTSSISPTLSEVLESRPQLVKKNASLADLPDCNDRGNKELLGWFCLHMIV
jgi:hypothetical protein